MTISNLMLVVLWATLAAVLFAREWVLPSAISRAACFRWGFSAEGTSGLWLRRILSRTRTRSGKLENADRSFCARLPACVARIAALLAWKLFAG